MYIEELVFTRFREIRYLHFENGIFNTETLQEVILETDFDSLFALALSIDHKPGHLAKMFATNPYDRDNDKFSYYFQMMGVIYIIAHNLEWKKPCS